MWKSYLLYSVCVFTLLTSCNEEDIKLNASSVVDWFAVPDRPGELGHLLHKIYKETGVSIRGGWCGFEWRSGEIL